MAEANKAIVVAPEAKSAKKKNRIKTILTQFILLLIACVIGAIAAKYYLLPKYSNQEQTAQPIVIPQTSSSPQSEQSQTQTPVEPEVSSNHAEVVAPPAPRVDERLEKEIKSVSDRLNEVAGKNNRMLSYFVARDLKESLSDEESFNTQLEFLRDTANGDSNLLAKIGILEEATANGLVTRQKLLTDLRILQKNVAKANDGTFTGSIKGALGNLVKVSKVDGEINADDHNSMLKRAELTLSKDKLTAAELRVIISDISKLGKPGEEFVKEANNLERVLDVSDFIVTYTKAKAIEAPHVEPIPVSATPETKPEVKSVAPAEPTEAEFIND